MQKKIFHFDKEVKTLKLFYKNRRDRYKIQPHVTIIIYNLPV